MAKKNIGEEKGNETVEKATAAVKEASGKAVKAAKEAGYRVEGNEGCNGKGRQKCGCYR